MILDVAEQAEASNLVGAAEIQEMLGLSRQRVTQLMQLDDFPEPFRELRMGKIYLRDEIRRWAKIHRYDLFDDDTADDGKESDTAEEEQLEPPPLPLGRQLNAKRRRAGSS